MISTEYDEELALRIARKEGRLEGKLEGKLEGRLEGKLEMIKKMLLKKFPIETIMEITDLTKDDILKVSEKM